LTSPPLEEVARGVWEFVRRADYRGYDPFDGLESRLFKGSPLRLWPAARLVWMQAVKRCPVDLRPWLGVPPGRNPKAVALCVSALTALRRIFSGAGPEAEKLGDWLEAHPSGTGPGLSWGYDFDWQSREFFAPRFSPNAICTVFAGHCFLDLHEACGRRRYLDTARAATEFLLSRLLRRSEAGSYFAYVPASHVPIHNVNLLSAGLLARVGRATGESFAAAKSAVEFSIRRQLSDGSWWYGEGDRLRWIDNFHTAYNLVALRGYMRDSGDSDPERALRQGYDYWARTFVREDGAPPYYPRRLYPLDVHASAQTILTLLEFGDLPGARRAVGWAVRNLRSTRGTFRYQIRRWYSVDIPFLRWGQAWMLLALARLLEAERR
jgi:hypothetical protein